MCFQENDALVSLLDITPTVLDWFSLPYPRYSLFRHRVELTGRSLLPLAGGTGSGVGPEAGVVPGAGANGSRAVFASHSLHEVTMYYPMRAVRTRRWKLVHNVAWRSPFPVDQDVRVSPAFRDLLARTVDHRPLPWFTTLRRYYRRAEWQLYDLRHDPHERRNVAARYGAVSAALRRLLRRWQNDTADPWICAPEGVLEDKGAYADNPQCLPLYNGEGGGRTDGRTDGGDDAADVDIDRLDALDSDLLGRLYNRRTVEVMSSETQPDAPYSRHANRVPTGHTDRQDDRQTANAGYFQRLMAAAESILPEVLAKSHYWLKTKSPA